MKITCQNQTFFIEHIVSKELFLDIDGRLVPLRKIENTFILTIEELLAAFKTKNKPLKFLNEMGHPIDFKNISQPVEFQKNSFLKQGKHTYFIFIDQDDQLSLIYNKKPSIMNFYNKDVTFGGMRYQNDKLILIFSFHSKYFRVANPKCFVKTRNQEQTFSLDIVQFSVTPVDARLYETIVEAALSKEQLLDLLGEQFAFETLNSNIYDFSFGFTINEMLISGFTPRIKFLKTSPELTNDEHWVPLNDDYYLFVRPYSTLHEGLSARIIPVPIATYHYYHQPINSLIKLDSSKKTIVCFEYPEKAQDNGMIFFKFLVDHYSKRFNLYYVITETSPDLKNLTGYEAHLIYYKSPENLEVIQAADVLCHTHSSSYVLPFTSFKMEQLILSKQKIFLQHGITGSKDVSALYGKKEPHPFTNLFVVSSDREKNLIERDYGFDASEIVLTGFARFDQLIGERSRWIKRYLNRKNILIMPTWRPKIDTYSDEQFMESDYYQEFQSLITDPALQKMHQDGYLISFYLHRNFQKFSHLFESEFVDILRQEEHMVKDLLQSHHMLITDYSSVGLDFSLMHKKVIYYRPLGLIGEDNVSESADLLPGDIIETREALIESLQEPNMSPEFKKKLIHIYKYKDKKASQRIFKAMEHHFHL